MYTQANGELTSEATSKAALLGAEIIGLTNGTTYNVEKVSLVTLTSNPTEVTESRSFWRNITLSLDGDTFKSFDWHNVVFGGDFEGLTANGTGPNTSTQVILVSVHGNVVRNTGVGTITIKGTELNGGSDVTVSIKVNPAP
ncbi:UNVERIFIED_CONTAM: hypothetical protein ABID98_005199 [Brevibacillus sp. OAP136]